MKRGVALGLCAMLGLSLALGCTPPPEVIAPATGREPTKAEIDADPWALLPSGAVALAEFDAQALFGSSFGTEAVGLLRDYLPLAKDSGLDIAADIDRVRLGTYATVGMDTVAVASGRFDADQIARAVEAKPTTVGGRTIAVHTFAGHRFYVVDRAALVPVTDKTLVFGSEIGVRRVIERIEEGRVRRALPKWYEAMLGQGAPLCLGIDLDAQPVPATVRTRLDFLEGLRAARVLGNFESPGLNLAGTLTYDRPSSAQAAEERVKAQVKGLDRYAVLMSVLQVPRPIPRIEAKATGKNTQMVAEIEGRAIAVFLERSEQILKALSQ